MNQVETRIGDLIRTRLPKVMGREEIAADTPLLDGGLNLDSVDLLELILMVEEEFGVVVEDNDLSVDLLQDVRSLARFVRGHLPTPSAP